MSTRRFTPLVLGPLPTDAINTTLGTELEAGDAYLSARAREHIATDHPSEYVIAMQHLRAVIADPTFVEQSPRHRDNLALVKRVRLQADRGHVLVAVGLVPDDRGRYRVRSGYLIKEEDVTARRAKGYMRALKR